MIITLSYLVYMMVACVTSTVIVNAVFNELANRISWITKRPMTLDYILGHSSFLMVTFIFLKVMGIFH